MLATLLHEGWPAVRDRLADRWRASQWRVTLTPAGPDDTLAAPILNLFGRPAAASAGDAAACLMARLQAEANERAIALLAPHRRGLSLDWWTSEARFSLAFRAHRWTGDPLAPDPDWLAAVHACGARTGARLIHVDGLAGLSLPSLVDLATTSPAPVVLTIDDALPGDSVARAHLSALFERVAAIVCPSESVGDALVRAFAAVDRRRLAVVAPGLSDPDPDAISPRDPTQVAVIGGLDGPDADDVAVGAIVELAARDLDVTIYGGGGHDRLRALRNVPGVIVRGYCAHGSLPALLATQGAAVALVPRPLRHWSAAVVDALAARVPVVARGRNPMTEIIAARHGRVVPDDASAVAIADAVDAVRRARGRPSAPLSAVAAASAHTALYLAIAPAPTPIPPAPSLLG